MAHWVIRGMLAIATRPGYRPGDERVVAREEVDDWLARARAYGIRSILCLLGDDQLPLYERSLPQGLLAYYREQGFAVAHLPAHDGKSEPFRPEQYEAAWRAFVELPKPLLVHCSAGHDRTGRVVRYILDRLQGEAERHLLGESAAG